MIGYILSSLVSYVLHALHFLINDRFLTCFVT
jgi:hypothetical protein